jgi:hypothetical protein
MIRLRAAPEKGIAGNCYQRIRLNLPVGQRVISQAQPELLPVANEEFDPVCNANLTVLRFN